ncbi:MAG: Veg family protein [Clostridia bacterium]
MITNMVSKESLKKIKQDVDVYIGQKICVKSNVGRNKCEYREGVLSSTYPSTFNVVDANTSYNLNYAYTDLLTNNLELTLPNGDSIAGFDYSVSCNSKF